MRIKAAAGQRGRAVGGVGTGALRVVPMNAFVPSRVARFMRIKAAAGPTRAPSDEQTLPALDSLEQRIGHILAALFMRIKSAWQKGGGRSQQRSSPFRTTRAIGVFMAYRFTSRRNGNSAGRRRSSSSRRQTTHRRARHWPSSNSIASPRPFRQSALTALCAQAASRRHVGGRTAMLRTSRATQSARSTCDLEQSNTARLPTLRLTRAVIYQSSGLAAS